MDVLRARAAIDLLLDQDSRPAGVRGTTPADTGADHPAGPYRAPDRARDRDRDRAGVSRPGSRAGTT